jgi:TolA-binding protein
MKKQSSSSLLFSQNLPSLFIILGGIGTAYGLNLFYKDQQLLAHKGDKIGTPASQYGIFSSIQTKIDGIAHEHFENTDLKREIARLRVELADRDFRISEQTAQEKSENIEKQNKENGADPKGITLDAIHYHIPKDFLPSHLYILALANFKKGDYEKTAVLLDYLCNESESDAFKDVPTLLLLGITWFKLDNYSTARIYFDKILENKRFQASPLIPTTILWSALAAKRQGKNDDTEKLLNSLMEKFPNSPETALVNKE